MASINDVADGDYHIVNCANTNLVLEVPNAYTANFSKVALHTNDYSDSKVWRVSHRPDGTVRLTYRFCGKVLESAYNTLKNGWQLSIYDNNDTDAQTWDLVPAEKTFKYGGLDYQSYYVKLHKVDGWYMECFGAAKDVKNGTVVDIAGPNTNTSSFEDDNRWLFVPVPRFTAGGMYEIYHTGNRGMCFDVPSASTSGGAAIQLWSRNETNAQKFVFEPSGDYFKIRAVCSNKYLTYANGIKNGSRIVQRADGNSDAFLWKVDAYSNTGQLLDNHVSLYGKDCQVVQISPKGNTAFAIDDSGNNTRNSAAIQLWQDNQTQAQDWALWPTNETNANIPAPYDLKATETLGSSNVSNVFGQHDRLYPTWLCPDAWPNILANHYEIRTRTRSLSSISSSWTEWTEWSDWETANVQTSGGQSIDYGFGVKAGGNRVWLADGFDATLDLSVSKAMQYGYEIRCVSISDSTSTNNVIGPASAGEISVYYMPTISIESAEWSPADGLSLDYTTDYSCGANYVYVTNLDFAKSEYSDWSGKRTNTSHGNGSVKFGRDIVPLVANGDVVNVIYSVGSDQWPNFGTDVTKSLTIRYDTSSSVDMTQTLSIAKGRRLSVTVPHVGIEELWMYAGSDGSFTRHYKGGTVNGDKTTFEVEYPFGSDIKTLVMGYKTDCSWGYSVKETKHDDEMFQYKTPAHAFTWDGGSFVIEASSDTLVTDRSINTDYESNSLNGREYETVTFGTTKKSHYTAEGLLYAGVTESVPEEIEKLLDARHVFYRAPSGECANVAITGVSYTTHTEYTKVTVNAIEETVV